MENMDNIDKKVRDTKEQGSAEKLPRAVKAAVSQAAAAAAKKGK